MTHKKDDKCKGCWHFKLEINAVPCCDCSRNTAITKDMYEAWPEPKIAAVELRSLAGKNLRLHQGLSEEVEEILYKMIDIGEVYTMCAFDLKTGTLYIDPLCTYKVRVEPGKPPCFNDCEHVGSINCLNCKLAEDCDRYGCTYADCPSYERNENNGW